jgi:cadmium resistance protein CadD (predicted permease)
MRHRAAAWVAWSIWALILATLVFTLVFGAARSLDHWTQIPVLVTFTVFVLAFSTVGALIASRRARNPIGWIMCASAIAYAIGGLGAATSQVGDTPRFLHQWLGSWVWGLGIALAGTFLLLLFPDGALPSRRWRPVAWVSAVGTAAFVLGAAFGPELAESNIRNPIGVGGVAGQVLDVLQQGIVLVAAATLASVVSLVMRFRRAAAEERHQLKWLTYAAALVALAIVGASLVDAYSAPSVASDNIQNTLISGALACVPVAIGIAIFRYRLYEIDRIINRTLVYVPLVAIIGGLATAMIPLSQRVFMAVTGNTSDAAVVLTTLFVASFITPVRKRLEAAVEGRFRAAPSEAKPPVERNGPGAGFLDDPEVEARIRSIAESAAREAVEQDRRTR